MLSASVRGPGAERADSARSCLSGLSSGSPCPAAPAVLRPPTGSCPPTPGALTGLCADAGTFDLKVVTFLTHPFNSCSARTNLLFLKFLDLLY